MSQAVSLANEIAAYLNTTYGIGLSVAADTGTRDHVRWFLDADSLSELDAIERRIRADDGYWQIVRRGSSLWRNNALSDPVVSLL